MASLSSAPSSVASNPPLSAHAFLGTDGAGGKIARVSVAGEVEWEFACENPQDCWLTPDGNYFFCHSGGVMEKLPDGRTLWEYVAEGGSDVHSCQPLPTGRYLVMENAPCRLVEVDTFGAITKETLLTPPDPALGLERFDWFRGVRRAADGHTWISRMGERVVEELGTDGKTLRRIPVEGGVHMALLLPNRHLLLALGDGHKIQELDANLNPVWEIGEHDLPGIPLRFVTGFQRLPNGNTVVCNYPGEDSLGQQPQVFEVTREKKVVWTYSGHPHFAGIDQIQVLGGGGVRVAGAALR